MQNLQNMRLLDQYLQRKDNIMHVYCSSCGYKNSFSSTRPKRCESCGEELEIKPKPKHHQTRKAHYEEPETVLEPEFDAQAIKASILLHPEENDNKFMTIEQLRKSEGSFARGSAPVEADIREQVIGEMLGTAKPKSPSPSSEGSSGVRQVDRLRR